MTSEQATLLLEKMDTIIILLGNFDQIIFLLQTIAIAVSFNWGVLMMKLIIHTKNQKNIL
jgi:hypothetical protein